MKRTLKPKIKLKPLEKTVVNTPTQKKYNTLMQVFECGGLVWANEDLPTQNNYWDHYREKTCIDAENEFKRGRKEFYQEEGYKVISSQEFYGIQKITPKKIGKIEEWFEKYDR